ncbi:MULTISPECIES: ATP-dependent nuclease [Bacillaceae]|uniref:AAA family ATPase n=1 Tax=Rossellomorea vietnamensis TaxID=218284 RepID=A0A6I6UTH8_9BACI|nr:MULTISPECIES: AAA family ATPase [Rossellomorea]MBW3111207.1 AAA family ATPase [Bacillus sp. MCCB 382]MDX8345216.1 AAA family ATPase [Rossellomorea sp. YZS02]QHE62861.1 AAA family ATPase [Rossellomorea vietnamensis]
MKISNIKVNNYRNLRAVDLDTNKIVVFIGDNNCGKSNLLRAITLPFMNQEIGAVNKNLGWQDINSAAKQEYYSFIEGNLEKIKNSTCDIDQFIDHIPFVNVEVTLTPQKVAEEYYVRNWTTNLDNDTPLFTIRYEYKVEDPQDLLRHISDILQDVDSIDDLKMNLLPIEFYKYQTIIPSTNEKVSYTDLAYFKYNALAAERDDFSNKSSQLGSKSLVSLLHNKMNTDDKKKVEQSYETFFNDLKNISSLEEVFNWQESSDLENAKDFFGKITLLPNVPTMNSLLNNVRLGYGDESLNSQGLGYRNLIYLFVMLNSLSIESDVALNILTIEEPEAHLSVSNEHLLASFINSTMNRNNQLQLFISTHSAEFLDKLDLKNVAILAEGSTYALKKELEGDQLDYLAKKPNLDFLKFLYSRNCILVEGPTEEMLIKSYLSTQNEQLNDIEVISLHKGFRDMLDIWLKVNQNTSHKIGIIRDFDNQRKAQEDHEAYNHYPNIYVTTTQEYTLEPEFVNTSTNFEKLKTYFSTKHGWEGIDTKENLSDKWRGAKTDTMLHFCRDIGTEELKDVVMPNHIREVIHFLITGEKTCIL